MYHESLKNFSPTVHQWTELASQLSDLPSESGTFPQRRILDPIENEDDLPVCQELTKAGFDPYDKLHGKAIKTGELNGHLEKLTVYKNWSIIPSVLKRQQKQQRNWLLAFCKWMQEVEPNWEFYMLTVATGPKVSLKELHASVDGLKDRIRRIPKAKVGKQVKNQASQIDFTVSGVGTIDKLGFFAHAHTLVRIKKGSNLSALEAKLSKHFQTNSHTGIKLSRKEEQFEEGDLSGMINYIVKPNKVIPHLLANCPEGIADWHRFRTNAGAPKKSRSLEFFSVYGDFRKFRTELKKRGLSIKVARSKNEDRVYYYHPQKRERSILENNETDDKEPDNPRKNVLLTGPSLPHRFGDKITVTRIFLNLTTLHEAYLENKILPVVTEGMLQLVHNNITLDSRILNLDSFESYHEKWNILARTKWFPWMQELSQVEILCDLYLAA